MQRLGHRELNMAMCGERKPASATNRAACLSIVIGMLFVQPLIADNLPRLSSGQTTSALDGETQDLHYWVPEAAATQPRPLFVFLHSWSSDYRQDNGKWFAQAVNRDWIYLHANFRGVNNSPKACGSKFARQDVLDAIRFICKNFNVDRERVYLAGVSGGSHMAMLMAGHHPDHFSAVSAWVGISDLAEWHRFHTERDTPTRYALMVEQSLSGPPGTSTAVDSEYRDRSSVFHLHQTGDLPVSLWAGVNDGHTGSVPVSHSLLAFNAIATGHGTRRISKAEIEQLLHSRKLTAPGAGDEYFDDELSRQVFLRRSSGRSMVTIFDGGHESIPDVACDWLQQYRRKVVVTP
jgi:pimeloyl-ACP methyl ester carboxylesterase